jgi:hypothetical protein
MLVKPATIKKLLEGAGSKLKDFLKLPLDKFYGQVRFRKVSPEASEYEKIKHTYIALGIALAIAILGYMALAYFYVAVIAHSVTAIIVLAPFAAASAALSGWAFSRFYKKRVIKIMVFIFFAATAVLVYGMFIFSVIFHALLLGIIACIAFFDSLLAWLAQQKVRRVMLVSGGVLLAIGAALQLASTFMDIY